MEKRVILTILLSMAVMFGYSFLVTKPPAVKQVQTTDKAQRQASTAVVTQRQEKPEIKPRPQIPMVTAGVRDIKVETGLYSAVFSTRGAALKKFVLKKYRSTTAVDASNIALIDEEVPENYSLQTKGDGMQLSPFAVYSASEDKIELKGNEKKSIDFVTVNSDGTTIKKTFTFCGDSYSIQLDEEVENRGGETREGNLWLLIKSRYVKGEKESSYDVHGPTTFADESLHAQKMKDLEKGPVKFEKNILWSGFEDKYFLAAAIEEKGSISYVKVSQNNGYVENDISSPKIEVEPGGKEGISYKLYFGPKDLDILKAQGNRLEEVIDFGWFSAIAKPLLYTLKFFHRFVGNYGVAIIIITVILKVLFYPLTNKSYKSMKEMQKLQPKMEALKEKYKNDRDAMNRAVMELYKTHKVNPMGGCLPMLVQIPVFFALYKALLFSIELRHAPFMLWIRDLSAPDALFGVIPGGLPLLGGMPIGPLPLLMGATMVIQQKMTPSNMDPMQAKMMMALPFIFTFMFLNFPSGLVLYWLVNNILTIAQQYYINKTLKES